MRLYVLFTILVVFCACSHETGPRITADFPGGNIQVVEQGSDTILLQPDLSDTEGDWFYWYFKVSNISGRTLTFKFTRDNKFTAAGPAYSINNRENWTWYGGDSIQDNSFTYRFLPGDTIAYFSMAIPYTQSHLDTFRSSHPMDAGVLSTTNEGREIEYLSITGKNRDSVARVLVTARHHACEMMANYVLEGIMESILTDPSLDYLRKHVDFLIVPFMDTDGVENGEQGKNRIPRDHNRDYDGESLYASTGALREIIPEWGNGKLRIALDLHCPWISGKYNEWIYLVGDDNPLMESEQIRFNSLLEKHSTGELKFRNEDFLPFGSAWNTGNNNKKGKPFAQWAGDLEGICLASTIEFPYGIVLGEYVTPDGAREFGLAVAEAIQEYLIEIESFH